jgi:Transglycosylase SLT domain
MTKIERHILFLIILMSLIGPLAGRDLYSYVDESGIRIFSNIGLRGGSQADIVTPMAGKGIDSGRISPDSVYYEDIISHYSAEHHVSPNLVKAMIQVESNYDPYAVSAKNCKGLMQLHPDTAERFGVNDIFNPEENISGGIKYFSFLMDHFDQDIDFALAAYNSGENTVKKYNGIPPYPETINYVKQVKSLAGMEEDQESKESRPVRITRTVDSSGNVMLTNY